MSSNPRGRPRNFDPDKALGRAVEVFLREGYDGASLDALTKAMGVNKPSLYAAFGDKHALFLKGLEAYGALAHRHMAASLRSGDSLEDAARALLEGALAVYAPAKGDPLGCLMATAATTAAGADPQVRAFLRRFFERSDALAAEILEQRFGARLRGPLTAQGAARLLNAVIHSLAIRTRAGEARAGLQALIEDAVATLAGGAGPPR